MPDLDRPISGAIVRAHKRISTPAASLFAAIAGSWLIGRALHLIGLRHSWGHALAEVLVLWLLATVAYRSR